MEYGEEFKDMSGNSVIEPSLTEIRARRPSSLKYMYCEL